MISFNPWPLSGGARILARHHTETQKQDNRLTATMFGVAVMITTVLGWLIVTG